MIKRHTLMVPLALLAVAACANDATTPLNQEVLLAQQAELLAQDEAERSHTAFHGWLARLLEAVRNTDNPEAQAFLEEARHQRQLAREAWEQGNYEAAREHHQAAFHALLSAVVIVFPEAPVATGAALDRIIDRIETFLGDRAAPRIRRVLAHVKELRARAETALEAGHPVVALALNLRAYHILHHLAHHIRDRVQDHDREADEAMHAVDY
jgi:HEPN domain-containing protein